MPGQVTGTIGDQDVRLENAATESTLEMLVASMEKIAKGLGVKGKDYAKELKNLQQKAELDQKNNKAIKEEVKERKNLSKTINKSAELFGKSLGHMDTALNKAAAGISKVFAESSNSVGEFTSMFSGVPVVGSIIGALGEAVQQNINVYRQLSATGIDLGGSLYEAQVSAGKAGLPLSVFANTVSQNSQALALLAGSAGAGAQIFTNVMQSMKRSGAMHQFGMLGMTMEEVAQNTASYMEIQTRNGRAQTMTSAQLAAGSERYNYELDRLARATGISRKALDDQNKALERDARFRLATARLGDTEKNLLNAQIAKLNQLDPTGQLAAGYQDLIASNGVPLTKAANNLVLAAEAAGVDIASATSGIFNGVAGSVADADASFVAMGRQAAQFTDEQRALTGSLMTQGTETYMGTLASISQFSSTVDGVAAAAEAQAAAAANSSNAVLTADQAFTEMQNKLREALIPILTRFGTLITDHVIPALESIIKFFEGNSWQENLVAVIAAGLTAMFAKAAISRAMTAGIDRLFSGGGAGAPEGGGGGGRRGLLGRAGSFLSRNGGRLLRGAAGGIGGLVGGMALDAGADALGRDTTAGAALDVGSSMASMAGTGAMIGSVIPGVGTAIGAGVGAIAGGAYGLYKNWGTFFGGDEETPTPEAAPETPAPRGRGRGRQPQATPAPAATSATSAAPVDPLAVQVAQTTTAREIQALAAALREVDYARLAIPAEASATLEVGTLKARELRTEVQALNVAFRDLDNNGFDKLIEGLSRLDESFKDLNTSFIEGFLSSFNEADKKTQEALLSSMGEKLDMLNNSMATLVTTQSDALPEIQDIAKYSKRASGMV